MTLDQLIANLQAARDNGTSGDAIVGVTTIGEGDPYRITEVVDVIGRLELAVLPD